MKCSNVLGEMSSIQNFLRQKISLVIVRETKTFIPKFCTKVEKMKKYCTKGNNSILMAKEKI